MRLCVVSHVAHYRWDGALSAYGAYAREVDVWAELFHEVTIVAPLLEKAPPGDASVLRATNVTVASVPRVGGKGSWAKVRTGLAIPLIAIRVAREAAGADVLHVRCPGNVGLVGALVGPLVSRRRIAKYAGQWTSYAGEPLSFALQRRLLASRWWRAPVTVYGEWPDQPAHVVPFFTSVLDRDHLRRAEASSRTRRFPGASNWKALFVGRLSEPKNVDTVIEAVARARTRGLPIVLTVLGDGPERERLEQQAERAGIGDAVVFLGSVPFESVLNAYEQHDILILPSESEGWPKAITEAMAFGLLCIGPKRGLVPEILGDGRGIVVEPGDPQDLTEAILTIARDPSKWDAARKAAGAWSRRFGLPGLRNALRDLMSGAWSVELRTTEEGGP